jgi:nucleoprotein TPR
LNFKRNLLLQGVSQPEPAPVTEPTSADHPSTEEVDTLKEQLAEARKALEDVRANAESAAAAPSETTADVKADAVQDDAETATLKTELEERETKLKEAEAALGQRESKVSTREGKVAEIQKLRTRYIQFGMSRTKRSPWSPKT